MPKLGRSKITVPYRHDLGRDISLRETGGYGVSGTKNRDVEAIIGAAIMAKIWPGKGCQYCAQEREGKREAE